MRFHEYQFFVIHMLKCYMSDGQNEHKKNGEWLVQSKISSMQIQNSLYQICFTQKCLMAKMDMKNGKWWVLIVLINKIGQVFHMIHASGADRSSLIDVLGQLRVATQRRLFIFTI